jgi:hypothetical protein
MFGVFVWAAAWLGCSCTLGCSLLVFGVFKFPAMQTGVFGVFMRHSTVTAIWLFRLLLCSFPWARSPFRTGVQGRVHVAGNPLPTVAATGRALSWSLGSGCRSTSPSVYLQFSSEGFLKTNARVYEVNESTQSPPS